ncbi:MAG: TonB-dependent receptor [Hyphomonadaceae bacterium]
MVKPIKRQLKNTLLVSSAIAAMSMLSVATAQDTVAVDDNEELTQDVITVTGIRGSLQSALNEKRNADSLTEVIQAIDIGKLPDQNLAEVLENITGVQITRTAGIGTGVQIRGTSANRTEINGVSTVGSGSGRTGINFEDVSAAIISSLEVIKAPQANTIEGSVGGTVNLRTIRPLDLNETVATFRVQGEHSNLSDSVSPRFSATVGDNWDTGIGRVGLVLSGSYTEQEATSFRPRVDRDNVASSPVADIDGPFLGIQFLNQDLDNFEFETINFAGTAEWEPTNNFRFFFDVVINDQEQRQASSRVQGSGVSSVIDNTLPDSFETVDFGSLGGVDLGSIPAALTGTIQPILAVDDDDPNLRFSSDTNSRFTESEIFRLGTDWNFGRASGRIEGSISQSDSVTPSLNTTLNFINPNPLTPLDGSSNDNGVPFIFDLTDGTLSFGIDFDSPFAPTVEDLLNPANLLLDAVQVGSNTTDNSEDAIRFDVSYDLQDHALSLNNIITSVDAGYRYNKTSSTFSDIDTNFSTGSIDSSPSALLFEELLTAGPDNFDDADGRELAVRNFLLIDPDLAIDDLEGTLAILQAALLTTPNQVVLGDLSENASSFFDIEEETHAVYGQANFQFGILRGNFGLRFVDTDINSFGNTVIGDTVTPVLTTSSYNEWLPRLNISADLTDSLLLRASWTEDIRRPNFNDLSTSVSFPTGPNNAVSIGNPDLAPESVTSFDVSLDWYFAPAAVFSIAFFHKDRDDLFVTLVEDAFEDPVTGFRDITEPCEQGGIFNPVPDRNVLSDTIGNGLCVPVSTIINDTGSTTQTGVELAFQYDLSNWEDRLGWASGFGLAANYTYQDFGGGDATNGSSSRGQEIFETINPNVGDVEAVQGLLDFSENSFNITGFYEKHGLSARARYTWRSDFRTLDTAGGASLNSTLGFPVVNESRGQLNASINYDVTQRLNVGVEAVNLLENNITQSCVNSGALTCFQGLPDRRIVFGATYAF